MRSSALARSCVAGSQGDCPVAEGQATHTFPPLFIKFNNLVDLFSGLVSAPLRFSDQLRIPTLLCNASTVNSTSAATVVKLAPGSDNNTYLLETD